MQAAADIKDRQRRRYITAIYFFLSGIITASWSSRIPDVQQKLRLDDAAWGSVLFLLPVGLVTGLLLSSWLVSRFGTTVIMIAGCTISCILLSLLGMAGGQLQLMITLFLFGGVRTILNMAINTQSVEVQRLYDKPIVSTFHGLWSVACFLAAAIGTLMIVYNVLPRWHFAIVAAVCLAVVLATRKKANNGKHIKPQQRPFFVKPDKYLLLLGLISFCGMLAESTMFDWSVNYFEKVVQADKKFVTIGYTSFIIAMSAGRLLGDRLIARFGPANMLMANGVLMATGFAVAAVFPYLLPAAIGFVLIGLGDSIVVPIVYSLSSRSQKMPPAYALASVTLIGYTGFLTGPLLVGSISEAVGMQWSLAVVGTVALGITFLTGFVKRFL